MERTKVVEVDEEEQLDDPTGRSAILSSIAQFLPEQNRSRMERLVREQELKNKRRGIKKKLPATEEKPLGP